MRKMQAFVMQENNSIYPKGIQENQEFQKLVIAEIYGFFKLGGIVGIFNALNHTKAQREIVKQNVLEVIPECQILWIESLLSDQEVFQNNINKQKQEIVQSEEEFLKIIEQLQNQYETLTREENICYMKIADIGRKVSFQKNITIEQISVHSVNGYLESRIVSFVMNLHISPRTIYLCRIGETLDDIEERVGGDSKLSAKGLLHAEKLAEFFMKEIEGQQDVQVYTSTMIRCNQTAEAIVRKTNFKLLQTKVLDDLNFGVCDRMTIAEINDKFKRVNEERLEDKLNFRYPRGESYRELINRIEPIIFEIERYRSPVLIVAHQTVLKCLYGYFHQDEIKDIPNIHIQVNQIVKLIPGTYHCTETSYII